MVRLLGDLACGPETGLEELNGDLPEADFRPEATSYSPVSREFLRIGSNPHLRDDYTIKDQ
jgi:hypothetical protein